MASAGNYLVGLIPLRETISSPLERVAKRLIVSRRARPAHLAAPGWRPRGPLGPWADVDLLVGDAARCVAAAGEHVALEASFRPEYLGRQEEPPLCWI